MVEMGEIDEWPVWATCLFFVFSSTTGGVGEWEEEVDVG